MQFWAITLDTMREIRATKIFRIALVLSGLVAGSMACISFDQQGVKILWYRFENASPELSTDHPLFRSSLSMLFVAPLFIGLYIGWAGTILGLIGTSAIFPNLMEKGAIDCVLARPLSRWKLFFAKYVGGLGFMAIQAAFFVILSFLIMGFRWKAWFPGYLWSIPLLVLLFSYLYCICVLFGLWTRSGLASLLLTIAAWFIIFAVQSTNESLQFMTQPDQLTDVKKALRAAEWFIPKTDEIPTIADRLMVTTDPTEHAESELFKSQTGGISSRDRQRVLNAEKEARSRPLLYTIGTSLLFEAAVLLFAGWRFSRQDF